MSTRSNIAVLNGAEGIKAIYCHSDGYPAHNGHILDNHYTPYVVRDIPLGDERVARINRENRAIIERKIADLIKLGDLSLLGELVHPDADKPHGFDYKTRQPGVTVAYGRDRGEKDTKATLYETLEDWHASMWPHIDYAYLYVGGTWLCAEVTDPANHTLIFRHVRAMINSEHVQRIFGT